MWSYDIGYLGEDIFQCNYSFSNDYIIDIGWYPYTHLDTINGYFWCRVIKDYAWDSPEESFKTNEIGKVLKWLSDKKEYFHNYGR